MGHRAARGRRTVIYPIPIREAYREINRNNPFTASYSENYTSIQYAPTKAYLLVSSPNTSPNYSYATTLAGRHTDHGAQHLGCNQ